VPFFISFSGRMLGRGGASGNDYGSLLAQFSLPDPDHQGKIRDFTNLDNYNNFELGLVTGFQFKLNQSLYLPFWILGGAISTGNIYTRDIIYKGEAVKEPIDVELISTGLSFGSGLFINTTVIKGGIYMGWNFSGETVRVYSPSLHNFMELNGSSSVIGSELEDRYPNDGFKLAIVPLVKTSEWKYIGKALDYILGYFGLGNALMNFAETEGDSKSAAAASAINAALDFSFNRIHWGNFSLGIQAMYKRDNFDLAAKTDTYGAKLTGLFSTFPFGFTLEGGYKHFASFASPAEYFSPGYPNGTGYFNGSIYFPLKRITLGVMYQYDAVYKSAFGIALSSNPFSGLFKMNNDPLGMEYGLRFRWGGWNAGK
jgi:hypothetical protein